MKTLRERKRLYIFVVLLSLSSSASSMPVATFLAKLQTIEAAGPLGTVTSDARLLKKEVQDSISSLHDERVTDLRKGMKPAYCPDAQATPPNLNTIMEALNEVPEAKRGTTEVKDALRSFMAKRFPCTR